MHPTQNEETTMTTMAVQATSPLMYVVTAIICGDCGFCPRILGVYTSQDLALKNARSFFEKYSETYRHGAFDKETDEDVIGQEDFSSDLALSTDSPCKRVFLEAYEGTDAPKIVIAINLVRFNEVSSQPIPLIYSERHYDECNQSDVKTAQEAAEVFFDITENRKVFVLMSAIVMDQVEYDPTLLGIFFEKDAAIEAAKVCFDKEKNDLKDKGFSITDSTDNTDAIGERGEILSFEFDGCYYDYIAIDAFVLDDDFAEKQVPFRNDIYMQLDICDFEEIKFKKQCIACKVEKSTDFYCTQEWSKHGEDRVCKKCLPEMTKMCSNCKVEKKYGCFLRHEWDSEVSDCNDCLQEMTKQCSHCKAEKKYQGYGRDDWKTGPDPLLCQVCKKELSRKTCSVCNVKKTQTGFHEHEFMKSDQQRTCKHCIQVKKENAKTCSICNVKKKQRNFSKEERKKPDQDCQCIKCSEMKDKDPQAMATNLQSTPLLPPSKRPFPVTNEKDDNSNKKPKFGTKQCTACETDKIRDDFSKNQWSKGLRTRRCKMCIGKN